MAEQDLVGRKIIAVRRLTPAEMEEEWWEGTPPIAIELEGGIIVYPSRDEEGNGAGAFFGKENDEHFVLM